MRLTTVSNATIYKDGAFQAVDISIDENGYIKTISPASHTQTKDCFDAAGKLVIPGFVNAHIHLGETILSKRLSENLSLRQYIDGTNDIFASNPFLENERAAVCAYTALESLRRGSTTLAGARIDEHCEKLGIRSYSGYILMKSSKLGRFLDGFEANVDTALANDTDMHTHFVFLHSLNFVDETILRDIGILLVRYPQLRFMVHAAEDSASEAEVRDVYGKSSVEVLDEYSLLGERTFLIHANCISPSDAVAIARTGSYIVHCPSTNLYLDRSVIPTGILASLKKNIIIGTDGTATSGTASLLSEARLAYLIHNKDRYTISFEECMDMITTTPAKALGMRAYDKEVTVGAKADLVTLKSRPESIGARHFYKEIILQERHHAVCDVIIDGALVLKDGTHTETSLQSIEACFNSVSKRLD